MRWTLPFFALASVALLSGCGSGKPLTMTAKAESSATDASISVDGSGAAPRGHIAITLRSVPGEKGAFEDSTTAEDDGTFHYSSPGFTPVQTTPPNPVGNIDVNVHDDTGHGGGTAKVDASPFYASLIKKVTPSGPRSRGRGR